MERQRRNTRQRELVHEAVEALAGTHPTAAQVYGYVHERDGRVSLATVYRNLDLLADEGELRVVEIPDGNRYDARTDGHAHIVCVVCGRVEDVDIPYDTTADGEVERLTSYGNISHRTVFEGVCPTCMAQASSGTVCHPL